MNPIRLIGALAFVAGALPLTAHGQSVPPPGWRTDFSKHTVSLDEIVSGGPPKDGIPPIDRPTLVSVDQADRWLKGREPHVARDRERPHRVNSGSITFCPLCNTALAFDRRNTPIW